MRLMVLLTCLAIVGPMTSSGQSVARPEFEVASVKVNASGGNLSSWDPDHHGNFKAENTSLKELIASAYDVPRFMISGPSWMESLKYDINARGTPGTPDSQVWLMLQTLLEERFHLRVHRETKEMAVYFLEVASGGLKIQPLDPSKPETPFHFPPGRWSALTMAGDLAHFAGSLSGFVERPVLDRTGVQGTFGIVFWYDNRPESEGPDLPAALREELGLRLTPGRGAVEILVVDHTDQTPTEN
jgi:uncharacterized protein (TIGR03435 family)